jgi:exopolyphosphatase/pppGpp-phosphohydrolase
MTDMKDMKDIIITCPHCNEIVWVEQVNCAIFRHGVLKTTMKQIHPHATKEECDYLIKSSSIYGCGKPFRIVQKNGELSTEICEYI